MKKLITVLLIGAALTACEKAEKVGSEYKEGADAVAEEVTGLRQVREKKKIENKINKLQDKINQQHQEALDQKNGK